MWRQRGVNLSGTKTGSTKSRWFVDTDCGKTFGASFYMFII